jgi:hypothetical protein
MSGQFIEARCVFRDLTSDSYEFMTASKSLVFRFADVEVREREFSLTKAGKVLSIEPKAFRLLLFLLHNPQKLITKDELLNAIWGDTAVRGGLLFRAKSCAGKSHRSYPRGVKAFARSGAPILKLFAALLVTLLAACAGCAVRRPQGGYLLSKIDSQYFLLPPDAAASQSDRQTIRISIPPGVEVPADCSIKGSWFSLGRSSGKEAYWIAQTPSASAWEASAGAVDMKGEWQSFENALFGLQQKQCFASVDEYLHVKQRIATSLSAPVEDTLFYRYSYGPGGYVDMAPKMQLRIERDFFDPQNASHTASDYRGTTITYYDVVGSTATSLKFLRVERRSAGSTAFGANSSDAGLTNEFASTSRLRLFLQDLTVSGGAKTPAILIGGALDQDLTGATQAIENDPGISCKALLSWKITCRLFDGVVTVSPMLEVFINGARSYVPIGSKLQFILPSVTPSQRATLMPTLRVERLFQGKVVRVQLPSDLEAVSQFVVFGGDRISWPKAFRNGK